GFGRDAPRAGMGPLALLGAAPLLFGPAALHADPVREPDPPIESYLLAQTALLQGEMYLMQRQPARAVEVLEAPLARINASRKYLTVLRDAYRAYVNELSVKNQPALVEKYMNRLRILERDAAGAGAPAAAAPEVPTTAALAGNLYNPVMPGGPPTTKARAKVDPFDPSFRQPGEPAAGPRKGPAEG